MSKKIDRANYGPSWTEVILGAFLSVILGVVLGAVLLIARPVKVEKELPKEEERVRGAVYYVEGSKDATKGKQAVPKKTAFVAGRSVAVIEDELNALAAPAPAAPTAPAKAPEKGKTADKGKAPEKGKEAEKPAAPTTAVGGMCTLGVPNFRLRDGAMQIAVPVTVNTLDLGLQMLVQARGKMAKTAGGFAFEPAEMYVGSCPVHRLPLVSGFVRSQILSEKLIPEDIKGAWAKLADAAIEGGTLKLTMP
jgi:hypothetical protein